MALTSTFTKTYSNPQKLYTPDLPKGYSKSSNTLDRFNNWMDGIDEKILNTLEIALDWVKKNPPVKVRTYYKTFKEDPFYKEAYFSQASIGSSNYSINNDAPFFKQVYRMWVSYNPSPHPGFINPKQGKLPEDAGWGKESWKNRAEQFKKEAKDFFNANRWKNIGIDIGTNFAADLIASSLSYGGYNISKKQKSFFTTDPYPINRETGRYLYKNSNHFSALRPDIRQLKRVYSTFKPVIFDNIFSYELKKVDNKLSCTTWLISPDTNVLKPSKFNYDPTIKSTHPINLLHARGSDLLSHKFTMYISFVYGKDNKLQYGIKENNFTDFQSEILKNPGFSVRIGSLSIPSIIKETFDINYLGTKVTKNRSSLVMNNQATVSFRLDQNLMWLNYFDNMAGHNNTIDSLSYSGSTKSDDGRFKNTFQKQSLEDWQTTINYIANSWHYKKIKNEEIPSKIIIVCKITDLSNHNLSDQIDNYPSIIFDDVKFLGTNSSLNYEREGSSPQSISLDFIYKKVYEIYPVVTSKGKPAETVKQAKEPLELKIIPEGQLLQLKQYKEEVEGYESRTEEEILEEIKKNKLKVFNSYTTSYTSVPTSKEFEEKTLKGNTDKTGNMKKVMVEEFKIIQKMEPPKMFPFFIPTGENK